MSEVPDLLTIIGTQIDPSIDLLVHEVQTQALAMLWGWGVIAITLLMIAVRSTRALLCIREESEFRLAIYAVGTVVGCVLCGGSLAEMGTKLGQFTAPHLYLLELAARTVG